MPNTTNSIAINSPLPLAYYRGNIVAVYHYHHKTLRYILYRVDENNYLKKTKSLRIVPESYDAEYEVKRIEELANKVNQAIIELSKTKSNDESITLKEIDEWIARSEKNLKRKSSVLRPKRKQKLSFIEEFENWIKEYREKKKNDAIWNGIPEKSVNNTVKDFVSALNLLKDYQYDELHDKPFYFDDIDKDFIGQLILYAYNSREDKEGEDCFKHKTKGNLSNKTLNKRFDCIFQFIKDHYKRLPNDVEKKPRLDTIEKTIIRLDREELRQLEELEFTGTDKTHNEFYRDCLVFLCYTGLRFSDFKKLNRTYYHKDDNLLVLYTEKTRKRCEIYLFDKAKEIGEKYDFDFKIKDSQVLNRGIKKLLNTYNLFPELVTFEYQASQRIVVKKKKRELISSVTGRKTYISMMIEHGMDVFDLISTTGHTNIAILKHYLDLFGKKRIEKFRAINEQLK